MKTPSVFRRVASRAQTLIELVRHLLNGGQFFLIPLLVVLLLAGLLLVLTEGFSYVAPFVYTIF
ncbi:MAG TPA: DUF5989 family protein [Polyangiaceae bacterium]